MSPRTARRAAAKLPRGFVLGALWGAAMAILEAVLFNRWFHLQIKPVTAVAELVLNYALYVGLGTMALEAAADVVRAIRGRRTNGSSRGANTTGRGLFDPVVAAVVGGSIPVLAVANFLKVGPLAAGAARVPNVVYLVPVVVAAAALGWVLYRLPRMVQRALYLGLVVCVAAGLLWEPLFGRYTGVIERSGGRAEPGSYRNVLFIVTDTLRRDFLDCYGGAWNASPAANHLAQTGALFENHIGQSTWTLPSTASVLTGQFPSSHGATAAGLPVSKTAPFLAEAFRDARYHTGAFTENFHILPRNGFGRGFDHFWAVWLPWVYDHTVLYRVKFRVGLPTIELAEKDAYPETTTRPDQVNWDARTTTDRLLGWLRGLDDAPFFAYVHYMGPHGPYGPPEYLLDADPPPVRVADHPKDMGGAYPLGEPGEAVSPERMATIKTLYAADILYVERQILRALEWLEQTGKADETLVVFTSDHGEEFYEHLAWNHGSSAFDETLRVPFIVSSPGIVPEGLRVDAFTRQIDVMPTILDLVGVECPKDVQGRSLRGFFDGDSVDAVPAYVEVYPVRPPGSSVVSLVGERGKIIRLTLGDETDVLLFDTQADPKELHNLAASLPDLYQLLLSDMDLWDGVARMYTPDADAVPLDPSTIKKLKSLGYID